VTDTRRQEDLDAESVVVCKRIDSSYTNPGLFPTLFFSLAKTYPSGDRGASEVHGMRYLLIGIGGFLGANARYLVAVWVAERLGSGFPYGTFIINVSGSFLLGVLGGAIAEGSLVHPNLRLFFAIGFLGAYTTFSTFSFENFTLIQERLYLLALANMLGSVCLGLIAVLGGMAVARLF
jgi:fluoride exporter